jgi:Na+/phosphate symporter
MPLVVAVAGLLVYALSSNAKVSELGRLLFFVGALWFVYGLMGKTLRLG